MTINEIILELSERISNNTFISPASWCEAAARLEILATDLDEKEAMLEAKMENEEARLVGEGMTSSKAKTLSKLVVDYEEYLKLHAKIKRIGSFIITARKRSQIPNL